MWDFPGPGLEPVSPALAGGFLTTAPPGKPKEGILYVSINPFFLTIKLPEATKFKYHYRYLSGEFVIMLCCYLDYSVF